MLGKILDYQEERGLELHEGGRQEVITSGHGTSKNVGSACGGMANTERFKLRRQMAAAAAGNNSTASLSLFMEECGLEVKEELSSIATQTWAEGA